MPDNKTLNLTPDEQAAEEADAKMVELVQKLNRGNQGPADDLPPNAIQASELVYWSALGNTGKVKLALKNGAAVNAADQDGYTALHGAAENGHAKVVDILIANGADPRARVESGETPADLAKIQGYDEIAVRLQQE